MKCLLIFAGLTCLLQARAQDVRFDKKAYKVGDEVFITVKHLDNSRTDIQVNSNIGDGDVTLSSDKKTSLGKLTNAGLFFVRVGFDTLMTRYYQLIVLPDATDGTNASSVTERVPFVSKFPKKFKQACSDFIEYLKTDSNYSKKIEVKSSWLITFKLYDETDTSLVIVPGNYALSGDISNLQKVMQSLNKDFLKTPQPDLYQFFQVLFAKSSLITPQLSIDVSQLAAFQKEAKKSKTPLEIYSKTSTDEFSLILNSP